MSVAAHEFKAEPTVHPGICVDSVYCTQDGDHEPHFYTFQYQILSQRVVRYYCNGKIAIIDSHRIMRQAIEQLNGFSGFKVKG